MVIVIVIIFYMNVPNSTWHIGTGRSLFFFKLLYVILKQINNLYVCLLIKLNRGLHLEFYEFYYMKL